MKYKATVVIRLKKGLLNPEGKAIKKALNFLNFDVEDVDSYKMLDIILNAENEEDAKKKVEEMCKKLLANPVIHNYYIKIESLSQ
ncbi:phosphoribosylformylglycinamidine synthase subunit PurS [Methanocaldococcus villosus KIN24-T80]|uniref:Phosphoribosylformylglycinamidine synthase subunit PurS n=1 Tax=Methanocaldococcus villosus KIN24-T80 TaxID=1069083 RepID=N6VSP3_9EURY|nr:phosphoribosylformylglycinamidine synthase subunit PurS [Methanocaldococcus villosus]ENN96206.1 phosphoribosylformylglycinamidine synthase subunit PurS [Methanocaldococcus villosus KIN24-T80]